MTHLSESTWIEGDYLYTTDPVVAAAWHDTYKAHAGFDKADDGAGWDESPDWPNWVYADQWRIPLSALPEVYGYREGEPWCEVQPVLGSEDPWFSVTVYSHGEPNDLRHLSFHINAVIPCAGSAESLRTLYKYVKEDDDA